MRANSGGVDVIPWYGFTYEGKFVKQGVTTVGSTTTIDPSAFTPEGTTTRWLALATEAGVNLNTFVSTGSNPPATVAVEIQNIINALNQDKEVNEQRWGLRPHRASLFTAYDFKQGRLKGLTVGGGARWSSANINGTRADGSEIYGRPLPTAIDLLLRYTHKVTRGPLRGTMSYQINVSNLLDQDGIVPQRFVDPENPDYRLPVAVDPGTPGSISSSPVGSTSPPLTRSSSILVLDEGNRRAESRGGCLHPGGRLLRGPRNAEHERFEAAFAATYRQNIE